MSGRATIIERLSVWTWGDAKNAEAQARMAVKDITAAGYRLLGPDETPDDAATTVYGRLLHRHMKATSRRAALFDLIEAFRQEFPEECQVWENRYSSSEDPSEPRP